MKSNKAPSIQIQEDLERQLLHGLACEWENALWVLPDEKRRLMRLPLFGIRKLKSRLAYWSCHRNEIIISRDFILNYPWDDVRDVLGHEMAHQYTDQVMGSSERFPHGPDFLEACQQLRANPKASGNYSPLHDRLSQTSLSDRDRILLRVKKLMSLASSTNRHEAEAAMAKAHELMHTYNLHLLKHSIQRNFISMFIGTPALRHFREEYHLANLLQQYYFVQGLWVSAYVLGKNKMGRVFEISGTPENVKIAAYVYDFVKNTIDGHWRQYNSHGRFNRYRKTDFAVGLVEGFSNKLSMLQSTPSPGVRTRDLVALKDPLLDAYISHRYPRTKSFQRATTKQDARIHKHGYTVGKDLVINKGIEVTLGSKKKLIGWIPGSTT